MKRLRTAVSDAANELPKHIIIGSALGILGFIPTVLQWLLVSVGLWNFDASLAAFNLRGWTNEVERPNQIIRSDSVWSLPVGTVARVKNGGFIAIEKTWSDYFYFAYTATEKGENKTWQASSGQSFTVVDNCKGFTFIPMSPPSRESDPLILFTVSDENKCPQS